MLCQNCGKKEANVTYTEIINGVKKEMVLCEKCSKELGINSIDFNIPINFSNFFGDLLNEYEDSIIPMLTKPKEWKCDICNMTYDDFMNTGKFGCSHCYDVFEDRIDPVLKRLQGSTKYVGRKGIVSDNKKIKMGKEEIREEKKFSKIEKLGEDLKQAIKEERYEDAAKIRDEIKKLEK